MPDRPLPTSVLALLARQDGVVARRQAESAGLRAHDIERLLRRRTWARIGPGVFVDHTGCPTWRQRAWAAVLGSWPAALRGLSAVRAVDGVTDDGARIQVAVDRGRCRPTPAPGVSVRRLARFEEVVQWNTSPPRQRYEEAVLDAAGEAPDDVAAVALLAAACAGRFTTAERLLVTLASRPRIGRRRWLAAVLADVRDGTHSVLEHGYLVRVERAHGLPRGRRQCRHATSGGIAYTDVEHDGGVVVELDGRAFHGDARQRDADLRRDLLTAADGGTTVRLGYPQVYGGECDTAVAMIRVLRSRGVVVTPVACGPSCPVASLVAKCGGPDVPGTSGPPH